MSKTVCYSQLNPRPLKKHPVISSIFKTHKFMDDFEIIDAANNVVNVKKKLVCTEEIDTDAVAQSFRGSTGIRSIAAQVAFGGNLGTIYDESGKIVDATKLPKNIIEAQDIINSGKQAKQDFNNLPKELTKNMSAEDFVKNYKEEDLINYIKTLYDKNKVDKTTETGGAE